jgi:hypothetical protein
MVLSAMYKLEIAGSTPNIMLEMKAVEKPVTADGKRLSMPQIQRSLDRPVLRLVIQSAIVVIESVKKRWLLAFIASNAQFPSAMY